MADVAETITPGVQGLAVVHDTAVGIETPGADGNTLDAVLQRLRADVTRALDRGDTLLLSNFTRTDNRFDANEHVFIHPVNVTTVQNNAINLPYNPGYSLNPNADENDNNYSVALTGSTLQFTSLVGGRLELDIELTQVFAQGNLPQAQALRIEWTTQAIEWTFDLTNVSVVDGSATVTITIPDIDYSGILNQPPDVIALDLTWRGVAFAGRLSITALRDTLVGPLHEPVTTIAESAAQDALNTASAQIDTLRRRLTSDEAEFDAIGSRISPIRRQYITSQAVDVYVQNTAAGSEAPTSLATFMQIDPNHATFTVGAGGQVFIAVLADHTHELFNLTAAANAPIALVRGTSTIIGSITVTVSGGQQVSFFIHRYADGSVGDTLQVRRTRFVDVTAWQDDIDQLKEGLRTLNEQVRNNAASNLPKQQADWLTNDLSFSEVTTRTLVASQFNRSFSATQDQAFFLDTTNALANGQRDTAALRSVPATRRGRWLLVMPLVGHADDGVMVQAVLSSGGTTPVIERNGAEVTCRRFLPAVPGTAREVDRALAPANRIGTGADGRPVWFRIQGNTAVTHRPVAGVIFFVENLPNTPTAVTVSVRYVANGHPGPTTTHVLQGVGGTSDVTQTLTLTLPDGATVTVDLSYDSSRHGLRVDTVPHSAAEQFPFDFETNAVWNETITTPARPDRTETIAIGSYTEGDKLPILFSPSLDSRVNGDDSTLLVTTPRAVVDTRLRFNTLFGANDAGALRVLQPDPGVPFDAFAFEGITADQATAQRLFRSRALPFEGLLDETFDHRTVAVFDTQMQAVDDADNDVLLGQQLIRTSPNGTKFDIAVSDDGTLSAVERK